jgi:hypothetical protein
MTPRDGLVVRANCTMTTTTGGTGAETRVWSQHPGHGRRPGNVCAYVPVSRAHPRSASTAAVLRPQASQVTHRPRVTPSDGWLSSSAGHAGVSRLGPAPHFNGPSQAATPWRPMLVHMPGRWLRSRAAGMGGCCVTEQQARAESAYRRHARRRRAVRGWRASMDDSQSCEANATWALHPCCRPSIRRCSSSRWHGDE